MEAHYIVDADGNRRVVLTVEEYEQLLDAQEELSDIMAHDEAVADLDLEGGREKRTLRRARGE